MYYSACSETCPNWGVRWRRPPCTPPGADRVSGLCSRRGVVRKKSHLQKSTGSTSTCDRCVPRRSLCPPWCSLLPLLGPAPAKAQAAIAAASPGPCGTCSTPSHPVPSTGSTRVHCRPLTALLRPAAAPQMPVLYRIQSILAMLPVMIMSKESGNNHRFVWENSNLLILTLGPRGGAEPCM